VARVWRLCMRRRRQQSLRRRVGHAMVYTCLATVIWDFVIGPLVLLHLTTKRRRAMRAPNASRSTARPGKEVLINKPWSCRIKTTS